MKKILGFAAMSLLALSCAEQEGMAPETKPEANGKYTLVAEIESPVQTRTTPELVEGTTNQYGLHWAEGDRISVFAGPTMENKEFILCDGDKTTSGTFRGDVNEGENISFAVYPYNAGHNIMGNYVMPSVYGDINTEYTPNTNAHMMAQMMGASGPEAGATPKMSFTHLGGVLALDLYTIPANVKGVVLTANKGITGEVSFDDLMEDCVLYAKESNGTNNSITIYFKPKATVRSEIFYFPLPVGTYQFKVECIGADDQKILVIDSRMDNEITRAGLKIMPKLPVAPAPGPGGYYEVTEALSDWTGKYLVVYAPDGIDAGKTGRIFRAQTCGFDSDIVTENQFDKKGANADDITFYSKGYIDSDHRYAGEYIEVTKADSENMYYVAATAYTQDEAGKYTVPSTRYLYQDSGAAGLNNQEDKVACKIEWTTTEGYGSYVAIWGRKDVSGKKDMLLMYRGGDYTCFHCGSAPGNASMNPIKLLKYREE